MNRLLAWLPITLFMIGFTTMQQPDTLVVFAASSLTDAFLEIETGFEAQHPNVDVVFNFAGSSTLAAQLAQGAPADVFASASLTQMNIARNAGRLANDPQSFATNRLAIVIPTDNPANIRSFADLAQPGVKLVVAAPGVPVREYTDQIIQRWAAHLATPDDFASAVTANIVSQETNVRQVVFKVAFGGADVGIVYTTDITPELADEVKTLAIPNALNVIATYPIAITNDTQQTETATAFIHYVRSESGQATLKNWGFSPVESSGSNPLLNLLLRLLDSTP